MRFFSKIKTKTIKKKVYCNNCGKFGHLFKNCNDPVTSLGIICVKLDGIDNQDDIIDNLQERLSYPDEKYSETVNIRRINSRNYNYLHYLKQYKSKIKFLLIRRKHTLGFIEFVRGRYDVNDEQHLIALFQQMTLEETKSIGTQTLEVLWKNLWKVTYNNKVFEKELNISTTKFNLLKAGVDLKHNLDYYLKNIKPVFNEPEWGFPKGRRNYYENNIVCAKREFQEETNYDEETYSVLNKLMPVEETFNGTNGVLYKHIYYLAVSNAGESPGIDPKNKIQFEEIGGIGWFTYDEARQLLRPYHTKKKYLLMEVLMFIIIYLVNYHQKFDNKIIF